MHPLLRNILAVITGAIVGSIINSALVSLGGLIIPPPPGVDTSTMEGLKVSFHLFGPEHFVFPFLAHAVGTLSGAFLAVKIAVAHQLKLALTIGVFFLAGGTTMVFMLPSPVWFNAVDLIFAYIPMSWLGWKLAVKKKS